MYIYAKKGRQCSRSKTDLGAQPRSCIVPSVHVKVGRKMYIEI